MHRLADRIVAEWAAATIRKLCDGLEVLLDRAAEVFDQFAEQSDSLLLRTDFLDAKHQLAAKAGAISESFCTRLRDHTGVRQPAGSPSRYDGSLSMLDKDDYDITLALDIAANNSSERNRENLHALCERLSAVLGGRRVTQKEVPLNPYAVVDAFRQSREDLQIGRQVQLVLVTLFDKFVLRQLDQAMSLINQQLAEAGILPVLRYQVFMRPNKAGQSRTGDAQRGQEAMRDTGSGTSAQAPQTLPQSGDSVSLGDGVESMFAPPEAPASPTADESIRAIAALLSERRRAAAPGQQQVPVNAVRRQESIGLVNQALASPQLQELSGGDLQGGGVVVNKQLLLRVRDTLKNQRAQIKLLTDNKRLVPRDQDVIEIVGMLFESVLENDSIPILLKTLLSRLHTSYLKIAINDVTFLQSEDHPARALLEQMLRLGTRWVDPERTDQGIFPALRHCVGKITDDPLKVDLVGLARDLDEREQQLRRTQLASEKRTVEAEQGQSTLTRARDMARDAIQGQLDGHRLPKEVHDFLQTVFSDYLSLQLLRNQLDTRDPGYREAIAGAGDLIDRAENQDTLAVCAVAESLGQLIVELLPHYEGRLKELIEQLRKPLEADVKVAPNSRPKRRELPPEPAEQAVLDMRPGTWLCLEADGDICTRPVKLVWINPHTRNMLFVDRNGVKVARMHASEVAESLRNGSIKTLPAPGRSGLLRVLFESIRKRLLANRNLETA